MEKVSIGLLFSPDKKNIVLMERMIREYNDNVLFNGIGGHVEDDGLETFQEAMNREFIEEAGVDVGVKNWISFASLKTDILEVNFFKAFSNQFKYSKTNEADRVFIFLVDHVRYLNLYPNLKFLIPIALDDEISHIQITKNEKTFN